MVGRKGATSNLTVDATSWIEMRPRVTASGTSRAILAAAARELERLATGEPDPERQGVLLRRAQRIRARLHAE